jgi:DNA repair exonuclease SbcCD ATPase subunit
MIVFEKVNWKNFLSTGNTPTEIILNKYSTTLVTGENGSGKSTMLDALTFGLFGKGFRGIKKDQLVNSVNERGCLVEVYFSIGSKKYHIIRGIKPTRFEIYVNDKMLNQDASSRDYQKHLENNILKLNYRSFTQVVMLGSSSFVPFMQLTAKARREVVEEILDIKIFSLMNWILKQKAKALKERQSDLSHEFDLLDTKISMTSDHIGKIREKSKTSKNVMEKKIVKNSKEIEKLYKEVNDWTVNVFPKAKELHKEKSEFVRVRDKLSINAGRMRTEIKWFHDNDDCPTCHQHIDTVFKEHEIEKRSDKITTNSEAIEEMNLRLTQMDTQEIEYVDIEVDTAKKRTSMEALKRFNDELVSEMKNISNIDAELAEDRTKLKIYQEDKKVVEKEKNSLTTDQNYYIIAKQLLQDSGIKTKIVRKYLPVMNDFINMYLNKLEFQVKFELDEEFNETIRSRYRDEFSYANFSEGEKMRIDLALLFTWRQIAKMKNSTNTNLLILDEIFDSSLDTNGTDEFLKILKSLSDENVFLVSHKPDIPVDKFENSIVFQKQNNFSRMIS